MKEAEERAPGQVGAGAWRDELQLAGVEAGEPAAPGVQLHWTGRGAGDSGDTGPGQTDEAGPRARAQNEVRKHFK